MGLLLVTKYGLVMARDLNSQLLFPRGRGVCKRYFKDTRAHEARALAWRAVTSVTGNYAMALPVGTVSGKD